MLQTRLYAQAVACFNLSDLFSSRSSRASKKTSQNLASKAISKAKVVADTIAEEQDIPPQSQEEPSSEKVEDTNVNTPASGLGTLYSLAFICV